MVTASLVVSLLEYSPMFEQQMTGKVLGAFVCSGNLTFGCDDSSHRLEQRLPVVKKSCDAVCMFFAHEVDYLAEKPRQLRVFTLELLL